MKIFKSNKTKFVARIVLVILLLMSAISLVSCSEPNCKKGQYFALDNGGPIGKNISIKAILDQTEYPMNDITFDLCIGLNNKGNLVKLLGIDDNESTNVPDNVGNWYYVIYALHENDWNKSIQNNESILNYAYVLREFPHKEAFLNDEYSFIEVYYWGTYYNHKESITVPKEIFFDKDSSNYIISDYIYIGYCVVQKSEETGEYISEVYNIGFLDLQYYVENDRVIFLLLEQN